MYKKYMGIEEEKEEVVEETVAEKKDSIDEISSTAETTEETEEDYKNGLKLNEDLAAAAGWSVDQIDSRTDKLVQQVTQLFKLHGGEA